MVFYQIYANAAPEGSGEVNKDGSIYANIFMTPKMEFSNISGKFDFISIKQFFLLETQKNKVNPQTLFKHKADDYQKKTVVTQSFLDCEIQRS